MLSTSSQNALNFVSTYSHRRSAPERLLSTAYLAGDLSRGAHLHQQLAQLIFAYPFAIDLDTAPRAVAPGVAFEQLGVASGQEFWSQQGSLNFCCNNASIMSTFTVSQSARRVIRDSSLV